VAPKNDSKRGKTIDGETWEAPSHGRGLHLPRVLSIGTETGRGEHMGVEGVTKSTPLRIASECSRKKAAKRGKRSQPHLGAHKVSPITGGRFPLG